MVSEPDSRDLTSLLNRAREGDESAKHQFYQLVYDELKVIARGLVRRRPDDSIQSTQLVNELMLNFLGNGTLEKSVNRKFFFSVAIEQMRRILIDYYRSKKCLKRGGNMTSVPSDQALDRVVEVFEQTQQFDLEALENAMRRLQHQSPRQYEVVKYRFYGGLSVAETAEMLEVSTGTVERDWRLARAKLFAELRGT